VSQLACFLPAEKDAFLLNLVGIYGFVKKHGRIQSGGLRLKLELRPPD
jgi:hypothetical protein